MTRLEAARLNSLNSNDLLYEPPRSYRPPPDADDEQSTGTGLHGRWPLSGDLWGGRDLLGAIGLSITAIAFVLFAGGFVDQVAENAEAGLVFGVVAVSAISLVLALTIATLTQLPRAPTVNMLGLAAIVNVLIHVISDSGESDLLGLPPALIESAILSGLPFGVAWLYVTRKHRLSLRDLGFVPPAAPTAFLIAIGAWLGALITVAIWSLLIADIEPLSPPDNATSALELAGGSIALAWLLVGLWGPVAEEIFFRGFLLGGLRSRVGPWPAILISSGIFAVFHIAPGLYVPTFVLGVAFGWVYLRTRSIWPSILAHGLHNTLAIVAVWQDIG